MKKFEHRITKHLAGEFDSLVYFCTESGECKLKDVPANESEALERVLNEYGAQGWELVNVAFGRDGLVAFWKREIAG